MASTDVLRARVDADLAREVRKWARQHDTDVSEAVRIALRRLIERDERERRAEAAVKKIQGYAKLGIFDPPKGDWKAGGFR